MRAMRHLASLLLALAVTLLLGGFLTAALVRLSPTFGVDQYELDPGRDVAALRALQAAGPPCSAEIWESLETGIARWPACSANAGP